VGYRHNSPCSSDLSHGGSNESERRTKPGKRRTCFTKRIANSLIAPHKIQFESVDMPQIHDPMVKRVIYQKMPRACNGASLFRSGRNLATDDAEAGLHSEIVQDRQ
jgi:hypothetical protein